MPTSATGAERPPRDAGFTLVEALVTLTLASLLAAAVVLSAPSPDRRTRDAAERLGARLALAAEESVILNRPIAFIVRPEGYGFSVRHEAGWAPVTTAQPLAFRAWPDGLEASVIARDEPDGERVATFDPLGGATSATIRLQGRQGRAWVVAVDAGGQVRVADAP